MEQYTASLSRAVAASDRRAFLQTIQVTPQQHSAIQSHLASSSIQTHLARIPVSTGNTAIDERLTQFISAHLDFIQHCQPLSTLLNVTSTATSTATSTQSLQTAHQYWSTLFTRSSTLFTLPSSPLFFHDAFRFVSSTFLSLSIRLDVMSNQGVKFPHLTDCTARLAGPVRAAGTDRTMAPGRETKRAAVMWLGNDCLRGYFKLNNLKLCETVLKSIREALARNREFQLASSSEHHPIATDPDDDATYPLSERVRYRYYLGRIRISQGRIRDAFAHLQWSFEKCHYDSSVHARRILLHLLPCALVLGLRPTPTLSTLIQQRFSDLDFLYLPLFHAYARPDLLRFDQLLKHDRPRKETLRRLGVYLMLVEKCPIGMWRGVVKRCLLLTLPPNPPNPNAPPTIPIARLRRAVQYCCGDEPTQLDVECILSSLIDQGYIKGYTFHSKQLLVLQKGHLMGFVPVRDVY